MVIPDFHDRNFVKDLDLSTLLVTPERCLMQAPLSTAVRSSAGSTRLGMLVTMVDVAGSDPALVACRPDWTATQDLSVHAAGWLTEGPIVVDARLTRLGKKAIVVAADFYDGHGVEDFAELQSAIDAGGQGGPTLAARSLLTFARIPGAAASDTHRDVYDPAQWLGEVRRTGRQDVPEGSLNQRIGLQVLDAPAGVVEVACTTYVANSIGTINGGVQSVMIEVAAESMRPGLVATDVQMHFLAQLKVGPARTETTLSRDAADHSVVTVRLVDAGAGDRLLTLATVVLQKPPQG